MESKQGNDSKTESFTTEWQPSPEREPLDAKWLFKQVISDSGIRPLLIWLLLGTFLTVARKVAPGVVPIFWPISWWAIGTFFLVAWSSVQAGPRPENASTDLKSLDDIEQKIRSIRYGPAPQGYRIGPKGGMYRIDKEGKKRYD